MLSMVRNDLESCITHYIKMSYNGLNDINITIPTYTRQKKMAWQ